MLRRATALACLLVLGLIAATPPVLAQGPVAPAGAGAQIVVDVRDELVQPLGDAQEALKAGDHAKALERLKAADAVADKSALERYVIERLRAAALSAAGDMDAAGRAIETAVATGQASGAELPGLMDALMAVHYNHKRYLDAAGWARKFLDLPGAPAARKPQVRQILAQALYLGADYAGAAAQLQDMIRLATTAGQKPTQAQLDLYASCFVQLKDDPGYLSALELLLVHYPKTEYWADLLTRLERLPDFSRDLSVDLFRLQMAAGAFTEANDYLEFAQLNLKAGLYAESHRALKAGFDAGLLGKGPDAERHRGYLRQVGERAEADQRDTTALGKDAQLSETGDALFDLGYRIASLGRAGDGIALMQRALDDGALTQLNRSRLRLAHAYFQMGDKVRARDYFKRVEDARANDGASDLARLWGLLLRP